MRIQLNFARKNPDSSHLTVRLIRAPRRNTGDETLLEIEPVAQAGVNDRYQAVLDLPDLQSRDTAIRAMALVVWAPKGAPPKIVAKAPIADLRMVEEPLEIAVTGLPAQDTDPQIRPKPEPRERPHPKVGLGDRLADSHTRRQELVASVQTQTRNHVLGLMQRKAQARDFAKGVIGRKGQRSNTTAGFVAHDADPRPIAVANRDHSLSALRDRAPRTGLRMRADLSELDSKELAQAARTVIARLGNGPLERKPAAFEPDCTRKSRVAKVRQESDDTHTPGDENGAASQPTFSIDEALAGVLASAGFKTDTEARPNQSDIAQSLQKDLSSGPADVPAYYDYPVLLTAWRDTWQAVLDGKVLGDVADIYDQMVQTVPPEYLGPQGTDTAEVNELQDLLVQLSAAASAVANVTAAPPDLISWAGLNGLADVWSYLGSADQERIIVLKDIHDYCIKNEWVLGKRVYINNSKDSTRADHDVPEVLTASQKQDFVDQYNYAYWEELDPKIQGTSAVGAYANVYSRFNGGAGYETLDETLRWSAYADPETGDTTSCVIRIPWVKSTDVYLANVPEFSSYPSHMLLEASVWQIQNDSLALEAAQEIINAVNIVDGPPQVDSLGRAENLINALQRHSDKPYQFDVFAPDTFNFGLLVNYRQKWTPLTYQAGDLAGTLPLAPQETRSFTIKRKTSRSDSSTREQSSATSADSSSGMNNRAEGEISRQVDMAMKTGATMDATSKGGILGNGGSLAFGGNFGSDMGNTSSQVKRDLRETTRSMAQAYKDENRIEVKSSASMEADFEQTRTISNPNNELTVTYLFYELQRRFEVSERLNDLTPVVLVAYKVPTPDAIDEAWLLAHDWILRDVLLDRQFAPVLRMLAESFTGNEVAVEILEEQWKTQLRIVSELRQQLFGHTELRDEARAALDRAAHSAANIPEFDGSKKKVAQELSMHLLGEANAEEAARQAMDWADIDLQKAQSTLREGIGALERATDAYTAAVVARLNRRTKLDHLILHIKENILHYMQAIWAQEHPDQRYLRLYDLKVDWPEQAGASFGRAGIFNTPLGGPLLQGQVPQITGTLTLEVPSFFEKRALHEVADLGKVLGFHGNYGVFRLKDMNAFSAYLLQDFLDDHFGVSDPDTKGEIPTAEEAIAMAKCAWSQPGLNAAQKDDIGAWLVDALDAAQAVSQMVVVPTGELFIEALPGSHPILEDFKLQHRALDTQKAATDVTLAEVEILRRAKRLQDGDASDPDVDKTVRIDGASGVIVSDV